jgi:hypothetical protein
LADGGENGGGAASRLGGMRGRAAAVSGLAGRHGGGRRRQNESKLMCIEGTVRRVVREK